VTGVRPSFNYVDLPAPLFPAIAETGQVAVRVGPDAARVTVLVSSSS